MFSHNQRVSSLIRNRTQGYLINLYGNYSVTTAIKNRTFFWAAVVLSHTIDYNAEMNVINPLISRVP